MSNCKEFNADYVFMSDLTLHGIGKDLYYKVLERYFPELFFNQLSEEYKNT